MEENKKVEVSNNTLINVLNKYYKSNVELLDFTEEKFKGGTLGDLTLFSGKCKLDNSVENFEIILKVQNKWGRFGDPDCWLREYLMYDTEVYNNLPDGMHVPICIDRKIENDEIWLWMDKLTGNHEQSLTIKDYSRIAETMGEFGLKYVDKNINYDFLSSKYWFVRNVDIWSARAIILLKGENKYNLDDKSINKLLDVWKKKDQLIESFMNLPTTICHRDLTPGNVFVSNDKVSVLDWDCTGVGIVGEDIADLFMEALVYYDFNVDKIEELEDALISNYHNGLNKKVELGKIQEAFDAQLLLNWSNRILCMFEDKDEQTLNRYKKIINYIVNR